MPRLLPYIKESKLSELKTKTKDPKTKNLIDAVFTYFTLNKNFHDEKSFKAAEKKFLSIISSKTKKIGSFKPPSWNTKELVKDYPCLEFKVLVSAVYEYFKKHSKYHTQKEADSLLASLFKLVKERDKKKGKK
jgi:hypothetical protein